MVAQKVARPRVWPEDLAGGWYRACWKKAIVPSGIRGRGPCAIETIMAAQAGDRSNAVPRMPAPFRPGSTKLAFEIHGVAPIAHADGTGKTPT